MFEFQTKQIDAGRHCARANCLCCDLTGAIQRAFTGEREAAASVNLGGLVSAEKQKSSKGVI